VTLAFSKRSSFATAIVKFFNMIDFALSFSLNPNVQTNYIKEFYNIAKLLFLNVFKIRVIIAQYLLKIDKYFSLFLF